MHLKWFFVKFNVWKWGKFKIRAILSGMAMPKWPIPTSAVLDLNQIPLKFWCRFSSQQDISSLSLIQVTIRRCVRRVPWPATPLTLIQPLKKNEGCRKMTYNVQNFVRTLYSNLAWVIFELTSPGWFMLVNTMPAVALAPKIAGASKPWYCQYRIGNM